MPAKQHFVARQQFVAEVDGRTVVVIAGARFPASDPIVRAHKGMFDRRRGR
jgi:hypothetical protein